MFIVFSYCGPTILLVAVPLEVRESHRLDFRHRPPRRERRSVFRVCVRIGLHRLGLRVAGTGCRGHEGRWLEGPDGPHEAVDTLAAVRVRRSEASGRRTLRLVNLVVPRLHSGMTNDSQSSDDGFDSCLRHRGRFKWRKRRFGKLGCFKTGFVGWNPTLASVGSDYTARPDYLQGFLYSFPCTAHTTNPQTFQLLTIIFCPIFKIGYTLSIRWKSMRLLALLALSWMVQQIG